MLGYFEFLSFNPKFNKVANKIIQQVLRSYRNNFKNVNRKFQFSKQW